MRDVQKELELTREQLARAERAMEAIRREILPANKATYQLMAEGYVEQIQRLRAQIDAYLGIDAVLDSQSNVVISLEGERVRLGDTAVGVMTKIVDSFRRGLQALVSFRSSQALPPGATGRPKRWVAQLCDLPLVAVQPGSLKIVLGEPDTEGLFQDQDRALLQENLRVLFQGIRWAASDNKEGYPPEIANDPTLQHLLLKVLLNLTPPRDSPVESIGFGGAAVGHLEMLRLRSAARLRLNEALASFEDECPTEVVGVIREVDLDKRAFSLRERADGASPLDCEYDETNEDAVKSFLDEPVIIRGILRTSRKTKRQTMEVESIEPDESSSAAPPDSPAV